MVEQPELRCQSSQPVSEQGGGNRPDTTELHAAVTY